MAALIYIAGDGEPFRVLDDAAEGGSTPSTSPESARRDALEAAVPLNALPWPTVVSS